jgi:mannan endo-1,4-beta-mannosidase
MKRAAMPTMHLMALALYAALMLLHGYAHADPGTVGSPIENTRSAAESCSTIGQSWPLCGADNGGWNFENGRYCIARSFCPGNRTGMAALTTRSVPVDAKANEKTRAVYAYLRSIWGKKIMFSA